MRFNYFKRMKTAVLAATALLLGAGGAVAQSVDITAAPSNAIMPDGTSVPMWGYSCTSAAAPATCSALNPNAGGGWSPIVIVAPAGSTLTINLTNHLPAAVPETSLFIAGQIANNQGSSQTTTASPVHPDQTITWPVAGTVSDGVNTPPPQGRRVQSFANPVTAGATGAIVWKNLKEGTYLIESGTHPSIQGPMGLYGILVVTTAPASGVQGTAYSSGSTSVRYDAEVPLLLSEIDPVQNAEVSAAVNTPGFTETAVWSGQPGQCGNPGSPNYHTCYPPAVNYTPFYFLINGVGFSKANAGGSLFSVSPASGVSTTGTVLVRLVNAGLHMHVPSIINAQTGNPAVAGLGLIAEDGNQLPGVTRVQNEVFLAAGKTYDVMINAPAAGSPALAIFDRQLSGLSANASSRDSGMLAYIGVNGSQPPSAPSLGSAVANADTYNSVINGQTFKITDPGQGVLANDVNVMGVQVVPGSVVGGTLTLNANGTFTFAATADTGSFQYCGNGATSGPACATVTLSAAPAESAGGITLRPDAYESTLANSITIKSPGVLANDTDASGYPLTVVTTGTNPFNPSDGLTVSVDASGSFTAAASAPGPYTFSYNAKSSRGTVTTVPATVTLVFPTPSNLQVKLVDETRTELASQDYRWIIEEDRTFYIDPSQQTNSSIVPIFGTNFHTSYMPIVAQGCTGPISCESGQTVLGVGSVCDIGNGVCHPGSSKTVSWPSSVHLDPTKRYYISVLPGDAIGVDQTGQDLSASHKMGGAEIVAVNRAWQPVNILVEPQNQQAAKLSVFVFEDDHPLNGEHDAGGGIDTLSPNEPGLGGFNITINDLVGGTGDSAGQLTYDEFNQPLSNALAGTIDPVTNKDACPISALSRVGFDGTASPAGITGVIPVCPKYEADGTTLSPLAGQAVVANLPPGRYGIVATPAADRIARGEEWLQTNTLDGGKDHESFLKSNEPAYFQEYGPAGYHVSIGFANPAIINAAGKALCTSQGHPDCSYSVSGTVTGVHMSRPSDERLYSTGNRDTFGYTQCYASIGSPDGADIAFTKCDDEGNFTLSGLPAGDWRLTIFDQWNDQIVDGISTPVRVAGNVNMGEIAVHAWKQNLYTRTFFDLNGDGVSQDNEPGLALVPTNIRYRDGSFSNFNSTDLNGYAGFNEVFPLFNWYVLETDSTRYKNTGTHVVNDAGGPVDGSPVCGTAGYPQCGTSTTYEHMARTHEDFPLPTPLRFPGARYCASADCPVNDTAGGSTARVDPPWVTSYGWQGFAGQNQYIEFGKKPFADGENGGIRGHVVYASTRPFDDPSLLLQLSWEPLVPHVTINLYQVGKAPDGSRSLTMVDSTQTSSWDDWAQGFRSDGIPNMNCPGQDPDDPFIYTLQNQTMYLDPQHRQLPAGDASINAQFKCYDGMHNWVQLQPAPYDGMYQFPSIIGRNPSTGAPMGTGGVNDKVAPLSGTNCTICVAGPDGNPMLPAGRYVVEMIVPPGYELVKEEDKNILLGDAFEAPVTSQFAGFGNIFIMPDQAAVAGSYNANNPLLPTTDEGAIPRHEGDTGSVETFWPCVGTSRVVPDYMSLFPGSGQNAPYAGATRPLCDRKEVVLEDQMTVLAKFYVFTSVHVAGHFTGIITDDFTSEFDPFSPHFGEKFSPANLPVSIKDFAGNEIARVYSDQHGIYNGLNYSSFSVNPPDPSGYIPQMMVLCMNDRGEGATADPLYQSSYSQFCYELPFMPGQTGYFDTPVIPTTAFAEGYNHPDCAYPDATPAISFVEGDGGVGPWISATGGSHTIKIHALGNQQVNNYAYSGPSATDPRWNAKTITRHYGFGDSQGTGTVTVGGVAATVTHWDDAEIDITLPASPQVPACQIQQQTLYGGSSARCGELVITAGNGKKSVDTITITVGGKTPTRLTAGQTIQSAIDAAAPGDLIIVPAGTYKELVLMWKPVRLQGVGAASTVIDANAHPSGKLEDWRTRIVCLFGLAPNGVRAGYDPGCGNAWNLQYFAPTASNPQVDRLPLEATVGWDATLNGNLAEQLQEPTLMGAYEGAGITVLSKGVFFPQGSNPFASDTFPAGTTLLQDVPRVSTARCSIAGSNPFPSNFMCNPSRIDGLSVTNSSQGGGGIYVHGWAHNLEISNNRVYNNQGTLAGGISVGQGEHPDAYLAGAVNPDPGSCVTGGNGVFTNTQLPYCFDRFVNVHHNLVTTNTSEGDELFSATPSGAGGVAFCTGADNYQFNYNWVCGNLSSGDGAGVSQLGFVWDASIQHNYILFNESTNPTTPTNGGGLLVMSAPDTDPTCPGEPDADCALSYGSVGDGIGRNLAINANLILGNSADAGAGGGLRLQGVNGVEVGTFPTNSERWYSVNVTNNIIANNVSGWDGAGVSLQDSLVVNLVNNTIVANDSTASSGVLFGAFFGPLAGSPHPAPDTCPSPTNPAPCATASQAQPAGVSSGGHSAEFLASLPAQIRCPIDHGVGGTGVGNRTNGDCRRVSVPILYNDLIWHNRAFHIEVGQVAPGTQQAKVTLAPALAQATTGECATGAAYWDIGIRGDTSPAGGNKLRPGGVDIRFTPQASVLSSTAGYPGGGTGYRVNTASDPSMTHQYCNGSRVPPENTQLGGGWYGVPPGTNEGNVPVPIFSLQAGATVDEGNNWINISWGPLSLEHPVTHAPLADFSLTSGSPAISYVTQANSATTYSAAPSTDFFENPRKSNNAVDVGAIEFVGTQSAVLSVTGGPLDFGGVVTNTTSASRQLTLQNTGGANATGIALNFSNGVFSRPTGAAGGTCGTTLNAGSSCSINVVFHPTANGAASGSLTITANVPVTGSPVSLSGTGVAQPTVSITPNPLTITLPTGVSTGTGTVTLTNTAPAGGASVTVTNVNVSGGSFLTYIFNQVLGQNNCQGATLNPGQSCTVGVRFTNVGSARGVNRAGTITFTDNASGSPQVGNLVGHAN